MTDVSTTDNIILPPGLEPPAVTIPRARVMLGDKAASEVYEAAGRGELDLIKDGNKTLVTVASIRRYMAALPPAKIKQYPPRKPSALIPPTTARLAKRQHRKR
jgi:hypothetical protein